MLISTDFLNVQRPDARVPQAIAAWESNMAIDCATAALQTNGVTKPSQPDISSQIVLQRVDAINSLGSAAKNQEIIDEIIRKMAIEVALHNARQSPSICLGNQTCFSGLPPKDASFATPKADNDNPAIAKLKAPRAV